MSVRRALAATPLPLLLLWFFCIIAIPVWTHFDSPPGWDVAIYRAAVNSLRAGHDPYADAIAEQQRFHAEAVHAPGTPPPYSYVYGPITLPLLRGVARMPDAASSAIYWTIYIAAMLAMLWCGLQLAREDERPLMRWLLPVAPFFPGLLANGVMLSGNIAYILYAAAFVLALYAWRRRDASAARAWLPFYCAVVIASCFKAPMLTLLAIPVLSARRQWIPAAVAAVVSVALFGVQPLLWPSLFAHYLQAVELQFSYNADFGCSPAGLLSQLLAHHGIAYSPAGPVFFLCYAVPLALVLLALSRRYLRGDITLLHWVPVMLTGIILLNPRIQEYDAAPLTLPLLLIIFRAVQAAKHRSVASIALVTAFVVLNIASVTSWELRKTLDGLLIVAVFCMGALHLFRTSQQQRVQRIAG